MPSWNSSAGRVNSNAMQVFTLGSHSNHVSHLFVHLLLQKRPPVVSRCTVWNIVMLCVQVCSECPCYTAIWVAAVLALNPFLWRKAKFTGDEVHGESTQQSSSGFPSLQWLHCCHVAALVTQKVFVIMHSSCFKLSLPIMIHENFIGCFKHS